MKQKVFLLAVLSALTLSGCDALDTFFEYSSSDSSKTTENSELNSEGQQESSSITESQSPETKPEGQTTPETKPEEQTTLPETTPVEQTTPEIKPEEQTTGPETKPEEQTTPETKPEQTNESEVVKEYYKGISSTATGSSLRTALCTLVKKNHVKYGYDTLEIAMRTTDRNWDKSPDPNDDNPYMNLLYLVDNENKPHLWDTNYGSFGTTVKGKYVWDKEHIWAKSNGFNTKSLPAYSDLHHLRASDKTNNNARSNYAFGEIPNNTSYKTIQDFDGSNSGKLASPVYEPINKDKGDVARALFYMATRYMDGDGSGGSRLDLTYSTDASGGKWGYLSTLLKWHEQDPPDAFEIKRNGLVQDLQGNRNPYIDHPEYAKKVFGN